MFGKWRLCRRKKKEEARRVSEIIGGSEQHGEKMPDRADRAGGSATDNTAAGRYLPLS